jgi:predicted nucleic acid-binding protein
MKAALDTNVLIYAEGFGDPLRNGIAVSAVDAVSRLKGDLPAQACTEFYFAITRKFKVDRAQAVSRLQFWRTHLNVRTLSVQGLEDALELARDHAFQIFDAIILVTASEGGCQLLMSEDMQDGFVYRGVTIVNPFAAKPHALLASYLIP